MCGVPPVYVGKQPAVNRPDAESGRPPLARGGHHPPRRPRPHPCTCSAITARAAAAAAVAATRRTSAAAKNATLAASPTTARTRSKTAYAYRCQDNKTAYRAAFERERSLLESVVVDNDRPYPALEACFDLQLVLTCMKRPAVLNKYGRPMKIIFRVVQLGFLVGMFVAITLPSLNVEGRLCMEEVSYRSPFLPPRSAFSRSTTDFWAMRTTEQRWLCVRIYVLPRLQNRCWPLHQQELHRRLKVAGPADSQTSYGMVLSI